MRDPMGSHKMWQGEITSVGATHRVIENAKRLKKHRAWTNEILAQRMTDTGYTIDTNNTHHLMSGDRAKVSVDEAIALSRAFDVPLVVLLTDVCDTCSSTPAADMHCLKCGAIGEREDDFTDNYDDIEVAA